MDFNILGPIEAIEGDQPVALGGAKQRALLGMLLLHASEVVSSDRLIDELWAGDGREEAIPVAPGGRVALRKALDGGPRWRASSLIVTRSPGYELRVDPERLDVTRFEALVSEGREALAAEEPLLPAGSSTPRWLCSAARRSPTSRTSRSPRPRSRASRSCGWVRWSTGRGRACARAPRPDRR